MNACMQRHINEHNCTQFFLSFTTAVDLLMFYLSYDNNILVRKCKFIVFYANKAYRLVQVVYYVVYYVVYRYI